MPTWKAIDDDDYQYFDGGDEDAKKSSDPREKYKDDVDKFKTGDGPMHPETGIVKDRCLTDVFCLVFFWAFIGSMIFATYYGYKNGDVTKLTAPLDASNNFCGVGDYEAYPKMLFTDFMPHKGFEILKSGICVSKCPQDTTMKFVDDENCKGNEALSLKNSNKFPDVKTQCTKLRQSYNTADVAGYCIPEDMSAFNEQEKLGFKAMKQAISESDAGGYLLEIYKCSDAIYSSLAMAFIYALLYIFLLSAFAEPIAWCIIFLIQIGLFAATGLCYFLWQAAEDKLANGGGLDPDASSADKQQAQEDLEGGPKAYLWAMIIFVVLALLFLCAVVCGRDQLATAIDVIDASADFIAGNKRVLLVPIVHMVLTLIVTILWLGSMICIYALNEIKPDPLFAQMKDVEWEKKNTYLALYMLFGFLWITAWVEYTSRFIVIVGAATYYFNNSRKRPDEEASADICFGFKCAYVHHMGSIAFGAFIIALIRFIRIVFYYLAKKAEKAAGDNAAVKCAIACAECLLRCIEKICDYLNEAAFCYMAVSGEHFLRSAWNGFLLNLKHGLTFAFAKLLAAAFIFLGKVGIVVGNCFTLYAFITYVYKDEVSSVVPPVLLVGVVTYVVASLFLALFDQAVMALLTCRCVDVDLNGDNAHFGPATFYDRLDKWSKAEEERQEKIKANEVA